MRSEGDDQKNGELTVGLYFTAMLQHTGRIWSKISLQITVTTLEHPPYSPGLTPAVFYLFFRIQSSLKGAALLWFYWHHDECDGRAEKAFTKWLPGMFPTPLQSLVEGYCCTRELFWKKCRLSDCADLYVSKIKFFRKYYEPTRYYLAVQMYVKKRTLWWNN